MSLQVIAKPVNESETTRSTWYRVQSSPSSAVEVPLQEHHLVCRMVCSVSSAYKEMTKNLNFLTLTDLFSHAGNGLKWLQGFPCRTLQTCFLIPAPNRNTMKSLQYFLTCWDMEGAHLEKSEYQGPWAYLVLILLQLAITLRLGRNKFKSLLLHGSSL